MQGLSRSDFILGNLADDLVDMTLKFCTKAEDKTLRFPKVLYSSYVKRIVDTSLDIQEYICIANSSRNEETRRSLIEKAKGKCVFLEHLIGQAKRKGWISNKQCETWQKLNVSIHWKLFYWK